MVRVKYVIPVLILVVCMTKPSYGKWVWNKETGWMQSTFAVAATLEQRYKYALSLIVEQKYVDAVKEFEAIIKTDPDSEHAEASQINIGWAYFLNGDYKRAMKAYEGAFQKFSGTKRTKEILEKMYQVGIVQMDTDEDAAIEILEKVIQKQQLGPLAPEAQVKIADCYFKKNQFDILLTNPPFGAVVKSTEKDYLEKYELGKGKQNQKTEILFIERCLDFLKPNGKMAIVLPDGILSNSSLQYVRDFLMEKSQILAVVSLPQIAFTHFGAGVKSSLMFVRKKKENERAGNYPIFMAIAEHIGYDATGRKDQINDLNTILEEYRKFEKSPKGYKGV